jgi:hypothetical protein
VANRMGWYIRTTGGGFRGVLQAAALVNVTQGTVEGVQVAPVNVAGDVRGAQIGLVNLSQRGGLPVSPLLNVGF